MVYFDSLIMSKVFEFGQNWKRFIRNYYDESRLEEAKKSLIEFCGENTFMGKTFLDFGCGSGLFSLAALELGARSVLSIDIDPDSVASCNELKSKALIGEEWKIIQGSILDDGFINELGKYDFVYSWGVLHHTGSMWKAFENITKLLNPDGLLYIAIYNHADGFGFFPDGRFGNSKLWLYEKRFYNWLSPSFQKVTDYLAMFFMILIYLILLRNPIKQIKNHKSLRGMSWSVDIKDWLGGYPYEYAKADEIFIFFKKRGFHLENLKVNNGLLNNEFLLRKL
jgi:2-polyprenyl-3-methyl-5-hydroxy-6-metoxy-1,4-benzoquinol methylase